MRYTSSFIASENAGTIWKYCWKAFPRLNMSGRSTARFPGGIYGLARARHCAIRVLQVVFRKDAIGQVAQLHCRIFQNRLLALAQRVLHDEPRRPRLAEHGLEVLVASGLEQAVGERVELGAIRPGIGLLHP